jgi:hypothetical protein
MTTIDEEIRRGFEAGRILSEPLLVEAFDAIKAAIMQRMVTVDVGARDAHRDLIVTLQLLEKLKSNLREHIDTGKLATITKETTKEKLRRVFG